MLGMGFLSYILFDFFSFYCNSQVAHSRSSPSSSKTTMLDVAASIQRTLRALSSEGSTTASRTAHALSQQDRSSLSVPLHSRISLHAPSHSDYKSLTLARLERDSAWVRSLTTRLDLAVRGVATSDLKPVVNRNEFQLEAEGFAGLIISRTSQGSGEYFSRVRIRKSPSQANVVLDMGSDVSWVRCAPCADCYQQANPIFVGSFETIVPH